MTRELMETARERAHERVVSVLEGYDLKGLARSVAAHVTALMEGSSGFMSSPRKRGSRRAYCQAFTH